MGKKIYNIICLSLTVASLFVLGACTPKSVEICDSEGHVFNTIAENYEFYLNYFDQNPNENGLQVTINGYSYVVRPADFGFYVVTRNGVGAAKTITGSAGYYYSEYGNPRNYSEGFIDVYMQDNIYCYQRD